MNDMAKIVSLFYFSFIAEKLHDSIITVYVHMSAGIMAKMVVQQPQPVMMANTSYSNQWSSGIFDCCENVAECESA